MKLEAKARRLLGRLVQDEEVTLLETRPLYPPHVDADFLPLRRDEQLDAAQRDGLKQLKREWRAASAEMEVAEWLRCRGLAAERRVLEYQMPSHVDHFTNNLLVSCFFVGTEDDYGASLREELTTYACRRGALADWTRPLHVAFCLTPRGRNAMLSSARLDEFAQVDRQLMYVTSRFERDSTNLFTDVHDQEQALHQLIELSHQTGWVEIARDARPAEWLQNIDRLVDLGFVVERLNYSAGSDAQEVERTGPTCRRDTEVAIARWSGECGGVTVSESINRAYRLTEVGDIVGRAYRNSAQAANSLESNGWVLHAANW